MKKYFLLPLLIINFLYCSEPIKIVYNSGTPPLKFTDENNNANGMLIDIWKLWAKTNNHSVTFIEAPWKQTIEMVKDGRADIHAGIYYTKERDKFLDYTSKPLYQNKNYFFYDKNIGDIKSNKDLKPFVIGIGNGYPNKFMKDQYQKYAIKTYKSANEVSSALVEHDVKVILSAMPILMYYLKSNKIDDKAFKYSDNTYAYMKEYFGAVKQSNTKLLQLINEGFNNITNTQLKQIEINWTSELEHNYLKTKLSDSNFTAQQYKYLQQRKEIKMCVDPDWMPFETIKSEKHMGIIADIYKEIQKTLEIPITLVPTTTWNESLEKIKNKECDILSAAAMTPNRQKYLNFTKTFLKFPQVIVTREKEPFIENFEDILSNKIGVKESSAIAELLKVKYPNINLVNINGISDALYKVSNGELYGFINTSAALSYNISKHGLTNLKIASKVGIDYYLKIAVRNDEPVLLDIMNQAIVNLDAKKLKEIKNRWLDFKFESIVDYTIVWNLVFAFLVILIIVAFFMLRQNYLKNLLEEQKKVFEDLFYKSTDPILLIKDGNFIDCNDATIEILEFQSKKDFLNTHPSKLSPALQPDGQKSFEKANQMMQKTLKDGSNHFEWVHTKANGENFWVDIVLTKININNADVIHVLWRDIQKRKEIEDSLNKFSQIIKQSQLSIIITDSKGVIEYINPYCMEKIGYEKSELIGHNCSVFKSGNQHEEFYRDLWKTILDGQTWQGDFSNKTKSGDLIWEHAIITPIFDNDQNIIYFAALKEDITERIKIDKQLKVAQEEALQANKAKSDFLAKMSHEIRTPMNAVLGMLYLTQQTKLTPTQEGYIDKASDAANSLLGIINDILDFSKIEANKLEIKKSEFNINQLIGETLSVMGFNASQNEIELLAFYDRTIPSNLISDKLRIGQILTNLISNAIKFTQKGEILVSIKLLKKSSKKVTLMFCIKDSGIGISKANQAKLFTEFSQVDNSQTRSFQGTGLGLAISSKLANLLNGKIWIEESIENIGSTFCFTIECGISKNQIEDEFKFEKDLQNLTILVVDDNKLAAEVLVTMLESFNYNVHIANNGYTAIEMANKNQYDLIFLDYKMPNLNGMDTFKKLKKTLGEKVPKTIMVTAYSHEIVNEDIEKIGIESYLNKPISPSTLYDKIIEIYTDSKPIQLKHTTQGQTYKNVNILLVEDNQLNQEFASIMLKTKGFIVDIANDGIEALQKIKSKKFDIVLMDIQMPNMDGIEAASRIRALDDDYFKTVPIIALSANALIGDREKSINAGMNEHVTKPINPGLLFKTLGKFLDMPNNHDQDDQQVETKLVHKLDLNIFDIYEALQRLNHDEETYIKLLKQFQSKYINIKTTIVELIQQNNIKSLEEKIHEIKGVCGNLGIKQVFMILNSLDKILKLKNMPSGSLFEEFYENLELVFNEISTLELKENSIDKQIFDKEKVINYLDKIKHNLENDIVECENNFHLLRPFLNDQYESFANDLSNALTEFDIDTADKLIESILTDLKND